MPRGWFGRWFGGRESSIARPTGSADLPVLPALALLESPARLKHVRDIERLAGIPAAHFDLLYRRPLESFACWVQQLPASEAHHHAGPGGMLDHALEVAVGAMAKRRVHLLPHGADPETIARQQHRWTYAVFSAALLHDIGKAAVDQHIVLFDGAGCERGRWDAWSGPMPMGLWYRVTFVRERHYRLHEAVSPLLARLILPQEGLSWLAEDRTVITEWLAAISGDRERRGVVAEIIEYADGASVARNLGANDSTRFPTARAIPLHDRLLTGLRYLLSTGSLPINRKGSAGWLVDDDLWLVSKRAIDALRDHLLQEGHSGIPTNNERIFDVLQEHGLLTANGDRAIWNAEVAMDGWIQPFTLLRFRAQRIWPDSAGRPESFGGKVTPIAEDRESEITTTAESTLLGETQSTAPNSTESPTISPLPGMESTLPDDTAPHHHGGEKNPIENLGTAFLDWLKTGAANGRLRINHADARLHVVPEGLLLVSPRVFKDFAKAINQPKAWDRIQGAFCQLGLHLRADDDGNIFQYKVELPNGNHSGTAQILKGIVVSDPGVILSSDVQPNPVLCRVSKQ